MLVKIYFSVAFLTWIIPIVWLSLNNVGVTFKEGLIWVAFSLVWPISLTILGLFLFL